jgi:hypothetical protein
LRSSWAIFFRVKGAGVRGDLSERRALSFLGLGTSTRRTLRPDGCRRPARRPDRYLIGLAADNEWEETYIEALEATGKKDEAQRLRWAA